MATIEQVSADFVAFYYHTFDTNRAALAALYQPDSMLTFEGKQFQGPTAILERLQSLQFRAVQHEVSTTDCQPCPGGGALVFVNGALITEDQEYPLKFAQVFTLMPVPGTSNFFVLNDIFRLCL